MIGVESGRIANFDWSEHDRMSDPSLSQIESLVHSHLQLSVSELPTHFPDVEMPRFLYGDRLQWISDGEATDWGVVIGRFYSFAPHCDCWRWCYLLWLDANSPSSAWLAADIAWEDDLVSLERGEIQ